MRYFLVPIRLDLLVQADNPSDAEFEADLYDFGEDLRGAYVPQDVPIIEVDEDGYEIEVKGD